jgi:WD40 repeat protein
VRTDPSLATEGDLLSALLRSPHTLAQVRGNSRLQDLALSPDGRVLAAGDNNGTVLLWDTRTMRRISTPLHVGDGSGRLAFSPDSRQLAVLGEAGSGPQAVVFDLATRQAILRLPAPAGDTAAPGKLTWTRDGRIVAVGSGTGALIFYNAATGREKGQVNVPGAGTSRAVDAYPAADKVLAIAEDTRDAVLVDPKTAHIIRRMLLPVPASGAGVSQDGRTVAVGDSTGEVFIDDLTTGKVLRGSRTHATRVTNLVFSPDGRAAASLSADENVMVWDVRTGKLRLTLAGHTGQINGGAFAPDGQTLYTDGLDRSVIKWDVSGRRSFGVTTPSFARIPLMPGPGIWPYIGWSADRRRAVLGYQSGLIATIDTATGRLVARDKPIKEISDLALSPDGRFAYVVSGDGTLRRWDVATRRFDKMSTLGTPQPKGVVSVSPDGRVLAVSTQSDNTVYLVDATTFRRIAGPVSAGFAGVSAFSRNGQMLALASPDGPGLAVLDVPSGRVRWANPFFADALSLGFSPDGRLIVAGSFDGTIATFDTQSGGRVAGPTVAHASVSWSAGCRLPPALNCTVPQAAGACATASGGPLALARNVSRIPPPRAAGQGASGPGVDSGRLSASAASRRTTARPVIVTGAGGCLARGPRPGSQVIVTTPADGGTRSAAGRGGCQLTWASTRTAVCPVPAPVTSTTKSRAVSTPGTGESENVRSQDGGPKSSYPGVNRRGRCACSQASTACGRPGTRQKATLSTSVAETTVVIGVLSASGARGNRRAPGGTANALRMAAASAAARSRGPGDVASPVVVCVAAQPATAMAAQAATTSAAPGAHRTCGRIPLGRPPGHHGSALR